MLLSESTLRVKQVIDLGAGASRIVAARLRGYVPPTEGPGRSSPSTKIFPSNPAFKP